MTSEPAEGFLRTPPAAFCRHLSGALQNTVYYLDADDAVRVAFRRGLPVGRRDEAPVIGALFGEKRLADYPLMKMTRPGEAYIGVGLCEAGGYTGRVVAGPFLCTGGMAGYDGVAAAAALLYQLVYGIWREETEIFVQNRFFELPVPATGGRSSGSTPAEQPIHHSIAYEKRLFGFVTQGNREALLQMVSLPPDGAYGLLDKASPLRDLKNDFICAVTLATRAAVDGGLDAELALTISDGYIQHGEAVREVEPLRQLWLRMLCDFADRVCRARQRNYSHRVNQCENWVAGHIYEKFTVGELAGKMKLSREYLSALFKKETGGTLSGFIRDARVEEAKRLLADLEIPIPEITSRLNFNDQSHFTRVFRQAAGVTPKKYREAHAGA